ncbi:helix-turn-helix domain-containing protein [Streptomyces milbemycinicus]|uniref:Helix-turn-helix domain-containing protein n=1 Tax=Streptomyces milbemycinicus TaxID=476552 RepID=A0ABW8LF62_9ACTN
MTKSFVSCMPKNTERRIFERAPRDGSGRFTVLPWPSPGGEGECLYLGLDISGSRRPPGEEPQPSPGPGDLILADSPQAAYLRRGDFAFFRIPCSYLGISGEDLRFLADTQVSGSSGVAALVSRFLTMLTGEVQVHTSESGRRLALNAVDLVALLVAELLGSRGAEQPDAGTEMLARIRAHIEKNLMDPGLSPESIARAHHISVRYLHKLFQSDGVTVSAWVRQRRLDSCRLDLSRAPNRRRTVAAVAQTWGFASPSHFSRLFRQTYGMSPREWQASASVDQ